MRPTTPCLAAVYPIEPAIGAPIPTSPATELVSTTAPPSPCLISGRIATSMVW